MPSANRNNLAIGIAIKRINKPASTDTNNQNKMVLPVLLNHRKFSISRMIKKYKTPIAKNRIPPRINSLT
ncbi:hypothetical protein GCM10022259_42720 [Aquimarina mytili]